MDNFSGLLLTFLICKLKNYNFKYNTSLLRKSINFDRYLYNNYIDTDIINNNCINVKYICGESTNLFLQELYYNDKFANDNKIYLTTNLRITDAFVKTGIFDIHYVKKFIHAYGKQLINFNVHNDLIYDAIHYRIGDKYMNDITIKLDDSICERALQKTKSLILNQDKKHNYLLVGDNTTVIKYIIDKISPDLQNKFLCNADKPSIHFHNISTSKELDDLMHEVSCILNSKKIYFCGLGPGDGFAHLLSLIGNIEYKLSI
jgi:hypothetical protein